MKRLFSCLGFVTIMCLSFILSEKTAMVARDMDGIMVKLKELADSYYVDAVDAVITDGYIVPGLNGRVVNINKSYNEMKRLGSFNDRYLVYDDVFPKVRLRDNFDKVIVGGNKSKNMVSLIFMVFKGDDISSVLDVLDKKGVKASFFIDSGWFDENNEFVLDLIKSGYTVGNLSVNMDYQRSEFIWINNILKTLGRQKVGFCYDTGRAVDLKVCSGAKNYTLRPSIVVSNNPLIEVKKQVVAGSFIELGINDNVNGELEFIIDYINSRGFVLDNLENHISEKNRN